MPAGFFVFCFVLGCFVGTIILLAMWAGHGRIRRLIRKWGQRQGWTMVRYTDTGAGGPVVAYAQFRDASGGVRTARITFGGMFVNERNLRAEWLEGPGPFTIPGSGRG
jgi:hypothetical protein